MRSCTLYYARWPSRQRIMQDKKIPYIVSVRQGDLDRLEKIKKHTWLYKKYKKIVDDASAVIAINEKIHNYLKNEFGIVSVLIPHGINKEIIEKKIIVNQKKYELFVQVNI